jgi:hypothetical protein
VVGDLISDVRERNVSFNGAFVGTASDERVTLFAPTGSPLISDNPVLDAVGCAVTDDVHSVIYACQVCSTRWVTEDARSKT